MHFRLQGPLLAAFLWAGITFSAAAQTVPHNVLFILSDDIGVDALSVFNTNGVGATFAPTPNIDALARQGVVFRNVYGYPSCSPTRSCLLTGRYGFRTGIGAAIGYAYDPILSPREFTVAKALNANPQLGIQNAHIGKWHLGDIPTHPNVAGGWTHFSGFLGGEEDAYTNWTKVVDGVASQTTAYATTVQVDDAIDWIGARGTNRWFLWFAPKSAHAPLHKPPNALHSYDYLPQEPAATNLLPYYQAMIETLDTELGRLLTHVTMSNTLVVFMSDNGTPTETIQSPFADFQCKGTLFEGGERVPMIFAGAGVVGTNRSTDAILHAVDIPVTLLDLAGVNLTNTMPTNMVFDGRSFAAVVRNQAWNPAETTILSENFGTIIPGYLWGVSTRGPRYKLVRLDSGAQAFVDLWTDPLEHTNLLGAPQSTTNLNASQLAAYVNLGSRLDGWHSAPQPADIDAQSAFSPAPQIDVPEQLGIAFTLQRATSGIWTTPTNYVRDVDMNVPIIHLTDPTPPPPPVFYRVIGAGR